MLSAVKKHINLKLVQELPFFAKCHDFKLSTWVNIYPQEWRWHVSQILNTCFTAPHKPQCHKE